MMLGQSECRTNCCKEEKQIIFHRVNKTQQNQEVAVEVEPKISALQAGRKGNLMFITILYDSKPELYTTINLRCATSFNIADLFYIF